MDRQLPAGGAAAGRRKVRITAAIIAKDEEQNLAELLPRLEGVDEIVVVDGGSADGTLDVATASGCRVQSRPFENFANQRNHACRLATGDWIFSIDADERPTPQLLGEIRRVTAVSDRTAYRVPIRSTIFGRPVRYSGTQDDRPLRLFRRGCACWRGSVHEVLEVDGPTGLLEGWLEHSTLPDLDAFLAKVHRYTTLEARARVRAGRPPRPCDPFLAPAREIFRRLVWKWGLLDGPAGWAFCLLSGLSEWLLAMRHRDYWNLTRCRFEFPLSLRERVGVRGNRQRSCHLQEPRSQQLSREVAEPPAGSPHPSPLPEGEGVP
jgi:glycosyltransferase involved in cell wall biosynthesis